MTGKQVHELFPREDIVYLTPDSDQVLQSVQEDKVYVIGGLVDETVQKVGVVTQCHLFPLSHKQCHHHDYFVATALTVHSTAIISYNMFPFYTETIMLFRSTHMHDDIYY